MYKQIKCGICNKRIKDQLSFDDLAKKNGWIKSGKFYICKDCQPKEIVKEYKPYKRNRY